MCTNALKATFQKAASTRSKTPGERIHSDLKEVSVRSKKNYKWAICFVDDCTRRGMIYYLERKSQALDAWRQFLYEEVSAKGYKVKYLRSDNGGEYIGEMVAFNNIHGIQPEYSPPHCQSGNGVAEVFWRDIFRLVRASLWDQQRDDTYWPTAAHFANYTRNRLLTSAVPNQVPEAAWQQTAPVPMTHIRVPLTKCWAYIEKLNRKGTLGNRRIEGVFVGYASHSNCYLVYEEATGTIWNRRYQDCKFDETCKSPEGIDPKCEVADTILAQLEIQAHTNQHLERTAVATPTPTSPAAPVDAPATPAATPAATTPPVEEIPGKAVNENNRTSAVASGFVRTTRNWTVKALAQLLGADADEYLQQLRSHKDWYLKLKSTKMSIKKGSDVPIPLTTTKNVRRKKKQKMASLEHEIEGVMHKIHLSPSTRTRSQAEMATALNAIEATITETETLWQEAALFAQGWYTTTPPVLEIPTEMALASTLNEPGDPPALAPKHFDAAHKASDSADWTQSEKKEWDGLWNTGTFEDQPYTGQKLHHLIWTYKLKSDGTKKARLVLDGRRQDPSTYDEIRSPTMHLTSFRILLAIAAQRGWDVRADDATQAFLNAKRPKDKPLWAAYPQGHAKSGRCMLLHKMLYGLHDAPRGWYLLVRDHLVNDQHLVQSLTDECMFSKPDGSLFVIVHVDDFCCTGTPAAMNTYKNALYARFRMTGGPIEEYYGLQITINKEQGKSKKLAARSTWTSSCRNSNCNRKHSRLPCKLK